MIIRNFSPVAFGFLSGKISSSINKRKKDDNILKLILLYMLAVSDLNYWGQNEASPATDANYKKRKLQTTSTLSHAKHLFLVSFL